MPPQVDPEATWRPAISRTYAVGATLALIAGLSLFGEILFMNGGLGWDGNDRVNLISRQADRLLVEHDVTAYSVGRSLPYLLVGAALLTVGSNLRDADVVTAFQVLNGVTLLMIVFLSQGVWRRLKVSERGQLLFLAGLLASTFVCKWMFFYAPLTDASAFGLGFFMSAALVAGRFRTLAVLTVLAAFVWPTGMWFGVLLLLFPDALDSAELGHPLGRTAVAFALLVLVAIGVEVTASGFEAVMGKPPEAWAGWRNISWNIAAWLVTLGMTWAALTPLIGPLSPRGVMLSLRQMTAARAGLGLGVLAGVSLVTWAVSRHATAGTSVETARLLSVIFATSIQRPAGFVVSHVWFFGPLIILAGWSWHHACAVIHRHGLGLTIVAAIGVCIALSSESRLSSMTYGILLPFLVSAVDQSVRGLSRTAFMVFCGFFLSFALVFSRLWFFVGESIERYFSIVGPWSSQRDFVVQGAWVLTALAVMGATWRRAGAEPTTRA